MVGGPFPGQAALVAAVTAEATAAARAAVRQEAADAAARRAEDVAADAAARRAADVAACDRQELEERRREEPRDRQASYVRGGPQEDPDYAAYLRSRLDLRYYPELWALRSAL